MGAWRGAGAAGLSPERGAHKGVLFQSGEKRIWGGVKESCLGAEPIPSPSAMPGAPTPRPQAGTSTPRGVTSSLRAGRDASCISAPQSCEGTWPSWCLLCPPGTGSCSPAPASTPSPVLSDRNVTASPALFFFLFFFSFSPGWLFGSRLAGAAILCPPSHDRAGVYGNPRPAALISGIVCDPPPGFSRAPLGLGSPARLTALHKLTHRTMGRLRGGERSLRDCRKSLRSGRGARHARLGAAKARAGPGLGAESRRRGTSTDPCPGLGPVPCRASASLRVLVKIRV